MIFCTYWYLVAVVAFVAVYHVVKNAKWRLGLLIGFCLLFHAHFAGPAGVLPIIFLGLLTYFAARSRNRLACLAAMMVCILALFFYKYTHFLFADVVASIAPVLGAQWNRAAQAALPALPPLAISFFTFEFVHYLFEVKNGREPISSFPEFVQFTFYFPSLVAGPIKRYTHFIPSLREGLSKASTRDIVPGLLLVLSGFFKKLVIADNLTQYIDCYSPQFETISIVQRWVLLFFIALRIYMDFSGYSDMAIGFSRMLGISLPPNFNWPYMAKNIQDFWRRWHISLSTWIRDYVYIPLGGSQCSKSRRVLNGLIAFALCGLWHGAALNFIAWGLYHGAGLAISSTYRQTMGPIGRFIGGFFDRVPVFSWAVTLLFVCFGWLLFFYPVPRAITMTELLFVR